MIGRTLVTAVVLLLLLPGVAAAFRSVAVGGAAPALTLDADGKVLTLPASGRVTVVVFWRPGQAFSDDALGDLAALAPAVAGKGVVFVAIAEASAPAAPRRPAITAVVDRDRQAADAFGVIVFPSTAVIDARGVLRAYIPSRRSSYRALVETHVRHALGEVGDAELTRQLTAVGEVHGRSAEAAQTALKRAGAAVDARRFDEAVTEFAQAIALQPDLVDAHLQLGYVRLETNEAPLALREFEFVLSKNPGSPGARVGIGIAWLRLGRIDDGIRRIEEAVVLNPEPVRGHYELGRAYESRGDVTRAAYHYRWALLKLLQGRK